MPNKQLVPLAFIREIDEIAKPLTILAGDVGGTKTNIALYRAGKNGIVQLREARYASQEYQSLQEIIIQFIGNEHPDRICMAVAGPVLHGKVTLTNLAWQLDSNEMGVSLQVPVVFINDLEANAYGLAGLQSNQLAAIHDGTLNMDGNIAIIAAGTGLGEAGLYFDGNKYHPFATEGGHGDFAPRTEQDVALWRFLENYHGHVSWERFVSGPGLHTIFQFLVTEEKKPVESWVMEQMANEDPSAVISNAALHQQEKVCAEALKLFTRYLATEAANLVLKLKATGGCYLGGGIAPKILPALQTGEWFHHFTDAGRMHPLLEQVPVYVILNTQTALLGAAWYGACNM